MFLVALSEVFLIEMLIKCSISSIFTCFIFNYFIKLRKLKNKSKLSMKFGEGFLATCNRGDSKEVVTIMNDTFKSHCIFPSHDC